MRTGVGFPLRLIEINVNLNVSVVVCVCVCGRWLIDMDGEFVCVAAG